MAFVRLDGKSGCATLFLFPNIILLTKPYNFSTLWGCKCTWLFFLSFLVMDKVVRTRRYLNKRNISTFVIFYMKNAPHFYKEI
jgi:hypothetical protein